MVRNRSKTTCNLPGTLVGHSKITISLLNSAWFARYSGFLVGSILVTNTPHRRLVSVVGGGRGIPFLSFFLKNREPGGLVMTRFGDFSIKTQIRPGGCLEA